MMQHFLKQTIRKFLPLWGLLLSFSACSGMDLGLESVLSGGAAVSMTEDEAAEEPAEQDELNDSVFYDESGDEIPVTSVDAELTEALDEAVTTEAATGNGAQATDESVEKDSGLEDITVADLPVTFPKGDDSDSEDCTSENVETIAFILTDSSGSQRLPVGRPGALKGRLDGLAATLLNAGSGENQQNGFQEQVVSFLPRVVLDQEQSEIDPYVCTMTKDESEAPVFAWIPLGNDELQDYELETGGMRVRKGRLTLSEQAAVLGFTGRSTGFKLSRDDFILSDSEADMIPYVILRPAGL